MVNQDPQPEIFTSNHVYAAATAVGTPTTNTIFTNQSYSEEVRIYAIQIQVVDSTTGIDVSAAATTVLDFDCTITAGANNVPSNPFDAAAIARADNRQISFSAPIVVNFQQPLQVTMTNNIATQAGVGLRWIVTLIGETGVIKRVC
tara:strand:+ start:517 stop:954 length:438 start_codon:yes stop_codon:yes gene_type:complete